MSIRKIGKRWQVRLRIGDGRRVERTLPPGATREDARELETQIRRARIDVAIGRKPQRLIDEALDQWLATGAKSLKSYEKDLKYRIAVLREHYTAGKTLTDLVTVAERVKAKGQEAGMSASGINRYLAILRRIGNLAERWGWTDLPLGRRVVLLPERPKSYPYLAPAQVQRLAAAADPLTGDMIRFAAHTGLRRGELLRLTPESLRGNLLIVDSNTKSGKPRGIPMPPEAARIARRRIPWGIGAALLRKRFELARAAAGLPAVRWHDLRHAYASWLAADGQPLTAVRDLLGHSSLSVTNRYAHLAPAHLAEAVRHLPSLRGMGGEKIGRKKKAA